MIERLVELVGRWHVKKFGKPNEQTVSWRFSQITELWFTRSQGSDGWCKWVKWLSAAVGNILALEVISHCLGE